MFILTEESKRGFNKRNKTLKYHVLKQGSSFLFGKLPNPSIQAIHIKSNEKQFNLSCKVVHSRVIQVNSQFKNF